MTNRQEKNVDRAPALRKKPSVFFSTVTSVLHQDRNFRCRHRKLLICLQCFQWCQCTLPRQTTLPIDILHTALIAALHWSDFCVLLLFLELFFLKFWRDSRNWNILIKMHRQLLEERSAEWVSVRQKLQDVSLGPRGGNKVTFTIRCLRGMNNCHRFHCCSHFSLSFVTSS